MRLIELYEMASDDGEKPMGGLVCVVGIMRSLHQREKSTAEGDVASVNEWVRQNGQPTDARVREWIENLGRVHWLEIPDSFIADWTKPEPSEIDYDEQLARMYCHLGRVTARRYTLCRLNAPSVILENNAKVWWKYLWRTIRLEKRTKGAE